jgi:hypothetical protein
MAYDSLLDRRNQRFTREELKTWLTGSLTELNAFKRDHPAEYAERHKIAERMGIVGPSLYKTPAPYVKKYEAPTRQYSADELKLRGDFSEDYCRQLFASGDAKAATALFESNREGYEDAKDAAISFNILPKRLNPRPQPPPAPEKEYLHRVSDLLCDESHIERGTTLPWEQVQQLVAQKVEREKQAREDAEAQIAQDRAAELATLTAVQQADQAERDKKIAELDRILELTKPTLVVPAEDAALLVARAAAAELKAAAGEKKAA